MNTTHHPNIPSPLKSLRRLAAEVLGSTGGADKRLSREAAEYWSASAADAERRDLSHWRGEGRWASDEPWRAIGEKHFRMYRTLLALAGAESGARMLEWGPGGGSNLVRFAREFDFVAGVDISEANLAECARQVNAESDAAFQPILIDAAAPETVLLRITEPIDLFLSTAVFQHFPGKAYGVRVAECARQVLAPGGLALIQTRYDGPDAGSMSKRSDYRRNALTFTSYRVEEFWEIAADAGFEPLAVTLEPETRYAYYFLKRPGGSSR